MIIISRLLFFVIKNTSKLFDDDEMENDELKIYYVYVEKWLNKKLATVNIYNH